VLGYYSPSRGEIVVVSESETPRLDGEGTLAHELVHALQDQHFDLAADPVRTRDAHQGRNGLVEGTRRSPSDGTRTTAARRGMPGRRREQR